GLEFNLKIPAGYLIAQNDFKSTGLFSNMQTGNIVNLAAEMPELTPYQLTPDRIARLQTIKKMYMSASLDKKPFMQLLENDASFVSLSLTKLIPFKEEDIVMVYDKLLQHPPLSNTRYSNEYGLRLYKAKAKVPAVID